MSENAQKRALQSYRRRLQQQGLARFEVMGPAEDKGLIKLLARRLAAGGPEADRLRAVVKNAAAGAPAGPGGILSALRRSPLVGADVDWSRPHAEERAIDL